MCTYSANSAATRDKNLGLHLSSEDEFKSISLTCKISQKIQKVTLQILQSCICLKVCHTSVCIGFAISQSARVCCFHSTENGSQCTSTSSRMNSSCQQVTPSKSIRFAIIPKISRAEQRVLPRNPVQLPKAGTDPRHLDQQFSVLPIR